MTEIPISVMTLQAALLLIGIGLWVWSATRARHLLPWQGATRLPPWNIPVGDFLLLLFLVVLFVFFGSQAAVHLGGRFAPEEPADDLRRAVISGYSFHLCSIVAWLLFGLFHPSVWTGFKMSWPDSGWSGMRGLLFAIPIILLSGAVWSLLLRTIHLPIEPQPLIEIIRKADNVYYLIALGVLAILIAPINEELLFRGGLFRFFNSHMPTPVAIILSSILFAFLHQNWYSFLPLVVLGSFLCGVTLKTGSLKPAMLMHALFNLNTIGSILFSTPG